MRDLSKMPDTVSKATVGIERINEIIKTENEVRDLPNATRAPKLKGQVEFRNVDFGYLIPRFYDPVSGCVKIDGTDIRNFTMKSLRGQMSFVLQQTLLFNAPIWQNIAYGKPNATRDDIVCASKLANAHEFIEKMPDGYDTIVSERGDSLSGRQRQRIAIARAIIRNSPILILDEPTTGLDVASEETVMEAIDRLTEGKTSIVIAHRLTTIKKADGILVIEDGKIVEQGTHKELLIAGGLYSQLYAIQSQDDIAAVS